ncbi:MAG: HDOD domain-containing protein [Pseudomonadota bacterium]
MDSGRIKHKIDSLLDLPGLPATVFETVRLLGDPEVSLERVSESIELDQSMTSKILRLVNSPFYGVAGKISTIQQALVVLGFGTVRNAMLSLSVFDVFLRDGTAKGSFDLTGFWEHAVGTGVIAKVLAQGLRLPDPDEFFIAGLLHDIGKIIIIQFLQQEFAEILQLVDDRDLYIREAETGVLGFDHSYVGSYLAKKWNMPVTLKEVIAFHHAPDAAREDPKKVSVVHLADTLCRGLGIGHGGDTLVPAIATEALQTLGINIGYIAEALPEIDAEMEQAADFMTIFSI